MQDILFNNFVPIVSFNDPKGYPITGISSGFFLFRGKDIFLLGALHSIVENVKAASNSIQKAKYIAIELYFEENKGAALLPFEIEQLNFLSTHNLKKLGNGYFPDFFFVKIKREYLYKLNSSKIISNDGTIKINKNHIFNKIVYIDKNEKYAFAGNIKPKLEEMSTPLYNQKIVELVSYTDMIFVREEPKNNTYIFKLNTKNKTIDDFKGCSGAPIVNTNNELVSIVTDITFATNGDILAIGVNLKHYEYIIDLINQN
ncbi:hypothetical protein CRU87_08940 [Aliarcobacter trophiarum LMG 25534]|uniref:Serine protease n=1 Tax=Aliarcobacter trophiarum LMG 25534 TaxID=1032241 RepID=A0AAD0QID2_9BACT|nr:hypothetical protein [Aliarcobacter trophiarum]AXK48457.1 hypothetical protein ATR_0586 [Aliarcobacter trophiarum LMG 25534]RXJ89567.1 hypothetical protein CRU87_08940 [Aliarcobacter trophiarum LMG 25534]